jgi:hypothetical protein
MARGDFGLETGALGELVKPFIGWEIGTESIIEAATNTNAYGQAIVSRDVMDDNWFKSNAILAGHALESLVPGIVDEAKHWGYGFTDYETEWGMKYSILNEFANTEVGVKIKETDTKRQIQNKALGLKSLMNVSRAEYAKALRKPESEVSTEELMEEYKYRNGLAEKNFNKIKDMYDKMKATGNFGEYELEQLLHKGIPKKTREGLDPVSKTILSENMVDQIVEGEFLGIDPMTGRWFKPGTKPPATIEEMFDEIDDQMRLDVDLNFDDIDFEDL